jgi:hypothetical protein
MIIFFWSCENDYFPQRDLKTDTFVVVKKLLVLTLQNSISWSLFNNVCTLCKKGLTLTFADFAFLQNIYITFLKTLIRLIIARRWLAFFKQGSQKIDLTTTTKSSFLRLFCLSCWSSGKNFARGIPPALPPTNGNTLAKSRLSLLNIFNMNKTFAVNKLSLLNTLAGYTKLN